MHVPMHFPGCERLTFLTSMVLILFVSHVQEVSGH